jgi:hypothetical protein
VLFFFFSLMFVPALSLSLFPFPFLRENNNTQQSRFLLGSGHGRPLEDYQDTNCNNLHRGQDEADDDSLSLRLFFLRKKLINEERISEKSLTRLQSWDFLAGLRIVQGKRERARETRSQKDAGGKQAAYWAPTFLPFDVLRHLRENTKSDWRSWGLLVRAAAADCLFFPFI